MCIDINKVLFHDSVHFCVNFKLICCWIKKKNPGLVYTGTNLMCISNTNRIKLFSFLFFERRKIELETMTIGSVDKTKGCWAAERVEFSGNLQ